MPTPHTEGRNAVEHSERSIELCGWAVVENGAPRGSDQTQSTGRLKGEVCIALDSSSAHDSALDGQRNSI